MMHSMCYARAYFRGGRHPDVPPPHVELGGISPGGRGGNREGDNQDTRTRPGEIEQLGLVTAGFRTALGSRPGLYNLVPPHTRGSAHCHVVDRPVVPPVGATTARHGESHAGAPVY